MSRRSKIIFILAVILGFALLRPDAVLACAACYGQSDSAMARGMNWGIFTLLGVVVCTLSAIALFFVHVGRRSAAATANETETSQPPKV